MNLKKFRNKKVLITGHTGFKGIWLTIYLISLGANVVGISLKPNKYQKTILNKIPKKNITNYFFNILNYFKLKKIIINHKPDFIFHLAAQPIVSKSLVKPLNTWKTNVIGTGNLLNSLRYIKNNCNVIIITSDKCYEVTDNIKLIYLKENDKLGGKDPYSASKASAEIIFKSFFHSYLKDKKNISIASARAGNVMGGGDWSEDRLIPDYIRAWKSKKILEVRNPQSIRPWQHVLDVINGYLILAKSLSNSKNLNGHSFNFGPEKGSLITVIKICEKFKENLYGPPKIKLINKKKLIETKILALNNNKAKKKLHWKCILNINDTLKLTSQWYSNYYSEKNLYRLYLNQINYYKINANRHKK